MNLLDRLLVWKRIGKLEEGYAGKKRDLESLVAKCNDEPPMEGPSDKNIEALVTRWSESDEEWGLLPQLREFRKIINGNGGEQ